MQDIETQVRVDLAELDRRLDELNRHYIRLQRKDAIKSGLIIGLIVYIGLTVWGIG